jgi:hypothetical protein
VKDDCKQLGIQVSADVHKAIKTYCVTRGLLMSFIVTKIFSDIFLENSHPIHLNDVTKLLTLNVKKDESLLSLDKQEANLKSFRLIIHSEAHKNLKVYCAQHGLKLNFFIKTILELIFIHGYDPTSIRLHSGS